jgi:putative addiction module CopG family antidote
MSTGETDGLSLTPEESTFVQNCLASGRYQSAKDVVQTGLRMLQRHEQERLTEIAHLRRMVAEGSDELDRGEGIKADEVFSELAERRERLQADQTSDS